MSPAFAQAQLSVWDRCPCCRSDGSEVTITGEEEAVASCSKCTSGSDTILLALGCRKTISVGRSGRSV